MMKETVCQDCRILRKSFGAAFAGILLLAFMLLSGCSDRNEREERLTSAVFNTPVYDWESTPQDTVVIWAREHDLERVYMQRAFSRYKELTGSSVEIVTYPQGEYEEVVKQAFHGEKEQPDVFLSYGGTNIEPFDPDNHFYDFSDAPWVNDLTATSINQTIYHGKVIGLPHGESSISGMLYNKMIFNKLGLKIPENQEEFLNVCGILKENGITPVYLPFEDESMMLYQFPLDSVLQDSDVLAKLNSGKLSYSDIPEMKTIVQWYRTMADAGFFGENFIENGWDGLNDALESGKYAMAICWDTFLYTNYSGDASDFGIMPAFMGVPEEGTFEGPNQALLIVNRNSERLDAALNLITFLADPYNYNYAFEGICTAPAFKNQVSSISTPQYVEAERLIERKFLDSTTWLRVRGFSQTDASCIQKYMTAQPGYTLEQCLQEMDELREGRIEFTGNKEGDNS